MKTTVLQAIEQHWAVGAIGPSLRARAMDLAQKALIKSAVGGQLEISDLIGPAEFDTIEKVSLAYEMASIDGLQALLHPSNSEVSQTERDTAVAGAFKAYELRRVLPLPHEPEKLVFHVLHLASLAYAGDQWADLRRWIKDRSSEISPPSVANVQWDKRLLFRIYECWLRLFRKQDWDDLDRIRALIAGMREDQKEFEKTYLQEMSAHIPALAARLVALYHWAKGTEILCVYMLQGEPVDVSTRLDQQFEAARLAAVTSGDASFDVILTWLHVAGRRMASGSIWNVAHAVNSRVTSFVSQVTKAGSMFELLPPQRAALQEQGLLDQASRAIVVELPTSGGKTALAEFRILQALNQFDAEGGWVAYVAPTRALVSQLTRRLRKDLSPISIRLEELTSSIEIDAFEQAVLANKQDATRFHILVATPEKLQLVIRNKAVDRPLALIVLDEAHNIEDEDRGLRVELLLATIKSDCPKANFLLMMPYVPNAADLALWLAPETGKTISIGTSAWKPNERLVGLFDTKRITQAPKDWAFEFETVSTTPGTIQLKGKYRVGKPNPLDKAFSRVSSLSAKTVGIAKIFSDRGTSIAIAGTIPAAWEMARSATASLPKQEKPPESVQLVQRFLANEISPKFELIEMLSHGVGVHHAGLSDEARSLMEWLAEQGDLRLICATTTIAQGINFPVSSIFLATTNWPYGKKMPSRAFWNLAGRAGRVGQDSVGVIGLAAGDDPNALKKYMSQSMGDLVSRLVQMLDELEALGQLGNLAVHIQREQWADFRNYVAHLWNEKKNLDLVLAETEQLLRNTLGYTSLQSKKQSKKAAALLEATRAYAQLLAAHPENASLADSTGFSPEGVRAALLGLRDLGKPLSSDDWQPESIFGKKSILPSLIGIMLRLPEVRKPLEELGIHGTDKQKIAKIANDWVSGDSIEQIAKKHFGKGPINSAEDLTAVITDACKGIYRALANAGTWGLSALSKMPTSGIQYDKLSPEQRRTLNLLPAMLYHGVHTENAVLMRMSSVPRSVAESLGQRFGLADLERTPSNAREFVRALSSSDWQSVLPPHSAMTGDDYRQVWARLSGE
jgi:hypothetical protein